MNIAIIGAGYVGLVTGTCFADLGINVTCIDINEQKINNLKKGIIPIYEPDLENLVKNNVKAGRLHFDTNIKNVINNVDIIFIAVGSPKSTNSDEADMSQVYQAACDIAENMNGYKVIVNKSTVPVGTAEKVTEIINNVNSELEFDVVSNPEFLREGSAIADFINPDRIVIGVTSDKAKELMTKLYAPLINKGANMVITNPKTAEMIKYAANSFLATKICFINEVAQFCEACGANVEDVALGIGLDKRIGKAFLNTGPGFGGSCFPKDIHAFVDTARQYNTSVSIVETVIKSNEDIQKRLAQKIINILGDDIKNKTLAILGLAFKANTDDIRQSPSISIIKHLLPEGIKIKAYDPIAIENAKKLLPSIEYCDDIYKTAENANALVIMTEWNEFKNLDFSKLKKVMKNLVIIDYRNLYSPKDIKDKVVKYISIGRPDILT